MVTAFVSERTKSKFVVCSKSSVREKLLQHIPVENLPQEYLFSRFPLFRTSYRGLIVLRYGGMSQSGRNVTKDTSGEGFSTTEKVTEVSVEPNAKYEVEKQVAF